MTLPTTVSYRAYWDARDKASAKGASINEINHAFWTNAIVGQDQLRQRVALALSEIFVVSTADGCGADNPQGTSAYFDMLGKRAFGTFRNLLEGVTVHPIMGCYLSHLRNQKEDLRTGRVPDENYAREVMQLFSIGLYQLNTDGSRKLGNTGQPIETYSADDVAGLAKVFTGWSFACPAWPSDNCFKRGTDTSGSWPDRWTRDMKPYAQYHSVSAKQFLGVTVPAQTGAENSLKIALDTLANHPNVAPFIGKQLIQRLVTSNPSPQYVARVSAAFTASGGNLLSTVRAILLDPEARNFANTTSPTFGKVREPLLRLSALLRAYGAKSATGSYLLWSTADSGTGLGQNPLQSPSVFNFFRPSYVPPGTQTADAGLVSPEMQILHESSAAGYVNSMRSAITWGLGASGYNNIGTTPDVRFPYLSNLNDPFMVLADKPSALLEDVNQRLMYGTMSMGLKAEILKTLIAINYPGQTANNRKVRLYSALLLTVASPEFQVQK